jgi:hypothetical protein
MQKEPKARMGEISHACSACFIINGLYIFRCGANSVFARIDPILPLFYAKLKKHFFSVFSKGRVIVQKLMKENINCPCYPCNRPWRTIGL